MTDLNSIPALTEEELERLGTLLEDEAERNDSFDFFAVHGFITGLLTGPSGASGMDQQTYGIVRLKHNPVSRKRNVRKLIP